MGSVWRKQCSAVSADTGRRCALLEGHPKGNPREHAAGRERFYRVAEQGQTSFPDRDELERYAHGQVGQVIDEAVPASGRDVERLRAARCRYVAKHRGRQA